MGGAKSPAPACSRTSRYQRPPPEPSGIESQPGIQAPTLHFAFGQQKGGETGVVEDDEALAAEGAGGGVGEAGVDLEVVEEERRVGRAPELAPLAAHLVLTHHHAVPLVCNEI